MEDDLTARIRSLHAAARALSDHPEGEWTFPLMLCRALAVEPNGFERAYEHLSSWHETTQLIQFMRELSSVSQVDPRHIYNISIGMTLFREAYYAPTGKLTLPTEAEPSIGRHFVQIVGQQDDYTLIFLNSWGQRWGDNGVGYLSREYFNAYVDLVIVGRPASVGPSVEMEMELRRRAWIAGQPGVATMLDVAASWYTLNSILHETVAINGRPHTLNTRLLHTFDDQPFEVVELRDGLSCVGRLHVIHRRIDSVTVIDECWIHPACRRTGYGSFLLQIADNLAARIGTKSIIARLHEADGSTHEAQARVQSFLLQGGYEYHKIKTTRPPLVGVGCRRLR